MKWTAARPGYAPAQAPRDLLSARSALADLRLEDSEETEPGDPTRSGGRRRKRRGGAHARGVGGLRDLDWRMWRTTPWFFAVVCLAAAVRLVAMIAYYPALEFNGDSYSYLWNAQDLVPNLWHPIVYPLFLRALSYGHLLVVVPLAQHLLGLATGLLVYRLVRHFGVGDLGATIAAAPVLLDAVQIDVEQVVLSEAVFEFLLFGGLYLLLTRKHTVGRSAAGGFLLGLASLTRTVSLPCAAAALLVLLVRRVGWKPLAATVAATALPLVTYAAVFDAYYGVFGLTSYNGRELYGETAIFAQCDKLTSAADRQLCPNVPLAKRASGAQYTWSPGSPLQQIQIPSSIETATVQLGIQADKTAGTFARHVIMNQPLDYARHVGGIVVHYFEPGRHTGPRDFPEVSWQFPSRAQPPPPWNIDSASMGFQFEVIHPKFNQTLADGLRVYQRFAYVQGPLLLAAMLLGCWGALRRRRDPRALIAAAFVVCGLGVLVMPSLGAGFDYRYVLPAQLFLPVAAVLGAKLLFGQPEVAEQTRTARLRSTLAQHRRAAMAGTGALAVVVLVANVAGAEMMPADRTRPGPVAPIGTKQVFPNGQMTMQVDKPATYGPYCVRAGHGHEIGYTTVFPVHVQLLKPGARMIQIDSFSVLGDARELFVRPRFTKARLMPDVVLSKAGATNSGNVQFVMTSDHGTLIYADGTGAGAVAWSFTLAPPKGLEFLPPGAVCTAGVPAAAKDRVLHPVKQVASRAADPIKLDAVTTTKGKRTTR